MLQSTNIEKEVGSIDTAKKIRLLLVEHDMRAKDLAEKINLSPSQLSRKLKSGDFLESELVRIAAVFEAEIEVSFKWKNGRKF